MLHFSSWQLTFWPNSMKTFLWSLWIKTASKHGCLFNQQIAEPCFIRHISTIDRFHSRDHKLSNRRHAAILVDKQTESRFTVKMVFCMIVDCGSQSARDKHLHFARVPSVVTNQGEEAEKLSFERRSRWISAISRADLTENILANDRVCGRHFDYNKEHFAHQFSFCNSKCCLFLAVCHFGHEAWSASWSTIYQALQAEYKFSKIWRAWAEQNSSALCQVQFAG